MPENHGLQGPLGTSVMIVTLQTEASNLSEFDGMSALRFPVHDGRRYYDMSGLEKEERRAPLRLGWLVS